MSLLVWVASDAGGHEQVTPQGNTFGGNGTRTSHPPWRRETSLNGNHRPLTSHPVEGMSLHGFEPWTSGSLRHENNLIGFFDFPFTLLLMAISSELLFLMKQCLIRPAL